MPDINQTRTTQETPGEIAPDSLRFLNAYVRLTAHERKQVRKMLEETLRQLSA